MLSDLLMPCSALALLVPHIATASWFNRLRNVFFYQTIVICTVFGHLGTTVSLSRLLKPYFLTASGNC